MAKPTHIAIDEKRTRTLPVKISVPAKKKTENTQEIKWSMTHLKVWNCSFTEHRPYLKQSLHCSWRTVPSHSWRRRCRTLSMKVKRFATRQQLTATLMPKRVRPSVQTCSEKPWKQTKKNYLSHLSSNIQQWFSSICISSTCLRVVPRGRIQ